MVAGDYFVRLHVDQVLLEQVAKAGVIVASGHVQGRFGVPEGVVVGVPVLAGVADDDVEGLEGVGHASVRAVRTAVVLERGLGSIGFGVRGLAVEVQVVEVELAGMLPDVLVRSGRSGSVQEVVYSDALEFVTDVALHAVRVGQQGLGLVEDVKERIQGG